MRQSRENRKYGLAEKFVEVHFAHHIYKKKNYIYIYSDAIYLSYHNGRRNDTANPLQFVTRPYFHRLHTDIYFGEKHFTEIQYA
jgi:hypothetical protein